MVGDIAAILSRRYEWGMESNARERSKLIIDTAAVEGSSKIFVIVFWMCQRHVVVDEFGMNPNCEEFIFGMMMHCK